MTKLQTLTEEQKRFIRFVREDNKKPIDVNDRTAMLTTLIYNLFKMYLESETETDKSATAYNIALIKPEIKKHIHIWHLLGDIDLLNHYASLKVAIKQKAVESSRKRRHHERDDYSLTYEQWEAIKEVFDNRCAYCGSDDSLARDHFYPFSKGGDFMVGNVIPACQTCNSSKKAKLFENWYPNYARYDQIRELKIIKYVESNKQLTLL